MSATQAYSSRLCFSGDISLPLPACETRFEGIVTRLTRPWPLMASLFWPHGIIHSMLPWALHWKEDLRVVPWEDSSKRSRAGNVKKQNQAGLCWYDTFLLTLQVILHLRILVDYSVLCKPVNRHVEMVCVWVFPSKSSEHLINSQPPVDHAQRVSYIMIEDNESVVIVETERCWVLIHSLTDWFDDWVWSVIGTCNLLEVKDDS